MGHRAASHHAAEHHAAECVQDWSARLVISAGFRAEVRASQVKERSNIKEGKETQSPKHLGIKSDKKKKPSLM